MRNAKLDQDIEDERDAEERMAGLV
jgi:hypothetical protein